MRYQPSLGGTLSLGRTNSFFLGGGRSMLNALYLTAESLGVDDRVRSRGDRSRHRRRHVPVGDRAARRRTTHRARRDLRGGLRRLRVEHRVAEAILGPGGGQLPDPRHAEQSRHRAEDAARSRRAGDRRSDPVPCGRDRRARAEIRRRHHHAPRQRDLRHRGEQARAALLRRGRGHLAEALRDLGTAGRRAAGPDRLHHLRLARS